MADFTSFMDVALEEAKAAAQRGEVPVGAVIVQAGKVIARAGNRTRTLSDPTAHAEILALRQACAKLGERLPDCDLYVTLEPCPMCAAALSFARIRRLYYAASDPKSGGLEQGPRLYTHPQCHHKPEVYEGLREAEAAALLKDFFAERRGALPLIDLLNLFEQVGEAHWAKIIKPLVERDPELHAPDSRHIARTWFGGMGSLNDVVLHPMNEHDIDQSEVDDVNSKLATLRADLFAQTKFKEE